MKQEEKQLLIKDICARLPYKVKIKFAFNKDIENAKNLIYVSDNGPSYIHNSCMTLTEDNIKYVFNGWLDECKPYLRSLSNMTEEEKETYEMFFNEDGLLNTSVYTYVDWLLEGHFDFRGLIPKGLALEATERMYNIK